MTERWGIYLLIAERGLRQFYLLPKLHKRGCLGRPVISGCNTPTQKISEFVDHHLKPLVTSVPSCVKDTNDFLKKLRDINTLPDGAIMVTIDVVGLYPHREALNNRKNPEIPTDLAELVLKNNNFEFNEKHYLQTLMMAISTKIASSYANLVVNRLERKLLSQAQVKPYIWLRYIGEEYDL